MPTCNLSTRRRSRRRARTPNRLPAAPRGAEMRTRSAMCASRRRRQPLSITSRRRRRRAHPNRSRKSLRYSRARPRRGFFSSKDAQATRRRALSCTRPRATAAAAATASAQRSSARDRPSSRAPTWTATLRRHRDLRPSRRRARLGAPQQTPRGYTTSSCRHLRTPGGCTARARIRCSPAATLTNRRARPPRPSSPRAVLVAS